MNAVVDMQVTTRLEALLADRRVGKDIVEPKWWPDDGGTLRVPVVDHNFSPPRVVRYVGWRACMRNPKHRHLSPDVSRIRLCDYCKDISAFD